eukprot:Colp12_sorted_trinity150504_noHs@9986
MEASTVEMAEVGEKNHVAVNMERVELQFQDSMNIDSRKIEEFVKKKSEMGTDFDRIAFDPVVDVLETSVGEDTSKRLKVELQWDNLCFGVNTTTGCFKKEVTSKDILKGISGKVKAGHLLAIMGASGAGKTTVLNLLAGRLTSSADYYSSGSVLVNGEKRNYSTWKKFSAYVMQDDDLFAELTVREHITFSAMLRLPSTMDAAAKEERVSKTIQELGLGRVENTIIGNQFIRGVSGGERKRVSCGVEMVTDPSLIFLDEPTSGLDSFNALNVMLCLRHLCKHGRTVITTIHQPRSNIFALFDRLLLLSDGRTMYFGEAARAVEYFGQLGFPCPVNFNPADYYIDLLSNDTRQQVLETRSKARVAFLGEAFSSFEKHQALLQGQDDPTPPQQEVEHFETSWFNELVYLCKRNIELVKRERAATGARLGQTLLFAILLGLIWVNIGRDYADAVAANNTAAATGYANAVLGVLFFMVVNQSFGSVFGVVFVYPLERSVVLRERASGTYRVSPYFVGKIISELPRTLFFTMLFTIIMYWMVGLRATASAFFLFWAIQLLTVSITESMTLCISTLTPDPQTASAIVPVFIVLAMLFGGFFIQNNSIPTYIAWGRWLSYISYAFTAVAQSQLEDDAIGAKVLNSSGLSKIPLYGNCLVLLGFFIFWRTLLYIILRKRGPKYDRSL